MKLPLLLRKIRKKVKTINGLHVVNIKWVREYLGERKFIQFQGRYGNRFYKKYKVCKCNLCGNEHLDKGEYTTWIYFWHIEEFINQGELPFDAMDITRENLNKESAIARKFKKVRKKK